MNILQNGCRYSDMNVYPSNWNTTRASIKKTWYIAYRFYDPNFEKKYPTGYRKVIKNGINRVKTLEDRQWMIKGALAFEKDLLENQGYNPILEQRIKPKETVVQLVEPIEVVEQSESEVRPPIPIDDRSLSTKEYLESLGDYAPESATPFITALWLGLKRTRGVPNMINDIGSVIRGTEAAAKELGFHTLNIEEIRKKHVMLILEKCAQINPKWSNNRHDVYKAYLRKIFKPLVTLEVIEMNPVVDIEMDIDIDTDIDDLTDNSLKILNAAERKLVDDHLRENHYTFWRFTQIFFHSGARETELMKLQESHVDLVKQQYKVLIKKRKRYVWVSKVIKDIALPYWQEVLADCKALHETQPSDEEIFLFGRFLKPGYKSIRPDQISRRWAKYVMSEKAGLGIKKRFYDIKHLHTTEMMDILSADSQSIEIEEAEKAIAEHNSHTTTAMVKNVYDVGNKNRKDDRVRKVGNSFA